MRDFSLLVPGLFLAPSLLAPCWFLACSLLAPCLLLACSLLDDGIGGRGENMVQQVWSEDRHQTEWVVEPALKDRNRKPLPTEAFKSQIIRQKSKIIASVTSPEAEFLHWM